MENIKERKGFVLFLATIFGNGEPANELGATDEWTKSSKLNELGNEGIALLRKGQNAVEDYEKRFPTVSKNNKANVKVEHTKTEVEKEVVKAPQEEQKGREIGD